VLKIVKHCREGLPSLVSGALLGLDQKGVLEITHSFPGVSTAREGADAEDEAEQDLEYQLEMMTSLREVNIDNNRVGWYQSMFLGTFNNFRLIQNLQSYHESIPNSVVVLYDPVQTANGSLTIRAFRLSDKYLDLSKSNEFIPPSEILQELPIKIRNPGMINALLFDLKASSSLSCDFERLDLSTNPYLEKNLEYLCAWVDDLATEQYKFREEIKRDKWRRKNGESAEDEEFQPPDRLASLLVNNQIQQYCQQIHRFSGASFGKLFLAGSLQKDAADGSGSSTTS
jgi:translation initiation factor 3 subunit H